MDDKKRDIQPKSTGQVISSRALPALRLLLAAHTPK